jgi:drug/metabolite transporter (DMT)-like permease
MIYLIGSIILSSWLTLSFKVVERLGIDSFQAIVFNYITCVITGSIVEGSLPFTSHTFQEPWIGWAVFMGLFFISLFNVVAFTAQKVGIAAASVAYKLSLVIPFGFSIWLYNEELSILKLAGIFIALLSVILTCLPPRWGAAGMAANPYPAPQGRQNLLRIIMPIILFVGSGLLDSMIKYVEQAYLDEANKNRYLIIAFASAACTGIIVLCVLIASGKQRLSWKAMLAGVAIGVPNYFSIWCLLRVLKDNYGNSSAIIPINNMGIVLFSAVIAWLVFKERLRVINGIGVILALLAIALIAYR